MDSGKASLNVDALRLMLRRGGVIAAVLLLFGYCAAWSADAQSGALSHQVLAFYYGWYGTPALSGHWVHWKGIDAANRRIDNSADFPPSGPYDSHDPLLVDRQVAEAHAAGVSGFIASWWGQGSFEDRGMPLLLDAAARHGLAVSAYYEILGGRGATHP